MFKASADDRDLWREELDTVSDFRSTRRFVDAALGSKGRQDMSRSPGRSSAGSKRERGREGGSHPQIKGQLMTATERQQLAHKFDSCTTIRQLGVKQNVQRDGLMCVNFAWSRTDPMSAHNTQGGDHP